MVFRFMVVTNDHCWSKALCSLARELGYGASLVVSHREAEMNLISFSPSHILIREDEAGSDSSVNAGQTWQIMQTLVQPPQVLRRCSHLPVADENFIRLPLNESTFRDIFQP